MFLQEYPPAKFNREFRNLLLDFIISRGSRNVRIDYKFAIHGIWDLLRVLDVATDNWEWRNTDEIIEQYNRPMKIQPSFE
ncbi:MAG TPA: hypothetical protein VG737_08790 [Cyclobacteriaceae bacterium]|nr:hypothetical protein [Cyclobacteriaceae bacterium]